VEARRTANADVRVIPPALFAAARLAAVPLPAGRPPTASMVTANRGRRRPAGSRKRPTKKKAKSDVAAVDGQRKPASKRTLRRRRQRRTSRQRHRQHELPVAMAMTTSVTGGQQAVGAVRKCYRWSRLRRQWRRTKLGFERTSHPNGTTVPLSFPIGMLAYLIVCTMYLSGQSQTLPLRLPGHQQRHHEDPVVLEQQQQRMVRSFTVVCCIDHRIRCASM
jgi:hypothetical protein